jgi:hypothetical protein
LQYNPTVTQPEARAHIKNVYKKLFGKMTAHDLLNKLLEYNVYFDKPEMLDTIPAKTRLEQINCLLNAFELTKAQANLDPERNKGRLVNITKDEYIAKRKERLDRLSDLKYVVSGEFLNDRPKSMYADIMEDAIKEVKHILPEEDNAFYERRFQPLTLFWELYSFRQKIFVVCDRSSMLLDGFSTDSSYAQKIKSGIWDAIEEKIIPIDSVLAKLLDPLSRQVNKVAIGYSDYDIEKIDQEWETDNF